MMLCPSLRDIATIIVKGVDYRCVIHGISKSQAVPLLENYILDDCGTYKQMHIQETNIKNRVYTYYFDNSVKVKKIRD